MLVTNEQLYNEIQDLKKVITKLAKREFEEIIKPLTVTQAAQYLGVGHEAVKRYIKSGELRAREIPLGKGKTTYRIRLEELLRFIENDENSILLQIEQKEKEEPINVREIALEVINRFHNTRKTA